MAKVMIPKEEFLKRQGLIEEDKTRCCSKVPFILLALLAVAGLAALLSLKEAKIKIENVKIRTRLKIGS